MSNLKKKIKGGELAAKAAEKLVESEGKKTNWKETWEQSKDKLIRFLGALVLEKDKEGKWVISIGRTSWWLAFLPALYIFVAAFYDSGNATEATANLERDITPNHLTILLTLATYNFGKKLTDVAGKMIDKRKGEGPG